VDQATPQSVPTNSAAVPSPLLGQWFDLPYPSTPSQLLTSVKSISALTYHAIPLAT
jgi:hypothetical protein